MFVRRPQLFDGKGKTDFIANSDKAIQFEAIVERNELLSQCLIGAQSDDEL